MAVKGIDLSHWQGHPNFAEVKAAGYEFAILKAGEGAGYLDGSFYESVGNAAGVGLIVGAYYFAQPGQSDGVTQAEAFLRILSRTKLVSNAWLDIEVSAGLSPAALAHWCDGFLSTLRAGFHGKVGAYSGQSYSSELGGVLYLDGDGKWIASPDYLPHTTFNLWQNSWVADVPSVVGHVDTDEWMGDLASFRAWLGIDQPVSTDPVSTLPAFRLADVVSPFVRAAHGDIVEGLGKAGILNHALAAIGCYEGELLHPDAITRDTVNAYAEWQRRLRYSGQAANGIPGVESLTKLASVAKTFRVIE